MENEEKAATDAVTVGAGPVVPAMTESWWVRHVSAEFLAHVGIAGWAVGLIALLAWAAVMDLGS